MRQVQYAWILTVLLFTGCASLENQDFLSSLENAQGGIVALNHALADAGDTGLIPRGSEKYEDLKGKLLDANEMMRLAWRAYFAGSTTEAAEWRDEVLAVYQTLRPLIPTMAIKREGE